jgi:hypothetical protein
MVVLVVSAAVVLVEVVVAVIASDVENLIYHSAIIFFQIKI